MNESPVSSLDCIYNEPEFYSAKLSHFAISEGRIDCSNNTYEYEYYMKDHLGNIRLSFKPTSTTPNITQEDFYYPFGLRINRKVEGDGIKYLYNGKEIEDKYDLYWYHYGARYYDPMIARWLSMDPADEFHSPYVYVGNDPVNSTDKDGREIWYFNKDGSFSIDYSVKAKYAYLQYQTFGGCYVRRPLPYSVTKVGLEYPIGTPVIDIEGAPLSRLGPDTPFYMSDRIKIFNGIKHEFVGALIGAFQNSGDFDEANGIGGFVPLGTLAQTFGGVYNADISKGSVLCNSIFISLSQKIQDSPLYVLMVDVIKYPTSSGLEWRKVSMQEIVRNYNNPRYSTIYRELSGLDSFFQNGFGRIISPSMEELR